MQLLKEYWPQFAGLLALVVWVVRMEASVQANARELRRLQHQRNEDQAAHKEARASTNSLLTEVRTDIKELLRRKE
ncbi:hypothetical protein [Ketogulonicigenium vulgare]|uniref:Uncharacterized protein n=1 Tax=Ketogulonicigenium vulgare (strain WSH-001) TaxID=759362 RepID=F9Y4N1_KETVW|nr:hypothetical protein [Ketogulonicigenium vulgare]ADO42391.1 conserved hypothetical protein [Ketogulonicigenium vulgare Y25]AEM40588.1 hypothetical protein KVU_0749 [Ketogulonicigenium vulgare WSH-001]ALJ82289.1 hypothetical protein KVH_05980 [Ketogulonicigenium vulgare]ANW34979.1 hypothetical protein KvSKV_05950 [Ketogulonicigenium vulgare]AOZ54303.1 hypothetical protein KVC_1286 [Ketogulonicigenium vulgare]